MANLLINGGIDFDQQREGASVTVASLSNKAKLCDGMLGAEIGNSIVQMQRVSSPFAGLKYAMRMTVTTGAVSVGNGDYILFILPYDAENYRQICYGTASAKATSFGFWAQSSITGTFAVSQQNPDGSRSLVRSFAMTANTPAWVALDNMPGCTDGTWTDSPSSAMGYLFITVAAGSTFQTATTNTWQSANYLATTSQTNTHITTVNSTFHISGLMHTVTAATQDYVTDPLEVNRVQRRYSKSYDSGVAPAATTLNGAIYDYMDVANIGQGTSIAFPEDMASTPSVIFYSPSSGVSSKVHQYKGAGSDEDYTIIATGVKGVSFYTTLSSGVHSIAAHWVADARLG